jgi:hypothetical protein
MSGPAPGEPLTAHLLRLERRLAFAYGLAAGVVGTILIALVTFWLLGR